MGSSLVAIGPALAVGLVACVLVAFAVAWIGRTGYHWEVPWAAIRATVQLVVLAAVFGVVAHNVWWVLPFAAVMMLVAAREATKRALAGGHPGGPGSRHGGTGTDPSRPGPRVFARTAAWALLPVAASPALLTVAWLAAGVLQPTGLSLLPVFGIYMGNAMAITGLAARRARDELRDRRGEVEAALSLGFSDFTSRIEVCRAAASTSITPTLDSTKTVGMVTIPGAFVGMVLGGASPVEAGVMQLFVSLGIVTCGMVSLVLTSLLVAARKI